MRLEGCWGGAKGGGWWAGERGDGQAWRGWFQPQVILGHLLCVMPGARERDPPAGQEQNKEGACSGRWSGLACFKRSLARTRHMAAGEADGCV